MELICRVDHSSLPFTASVTAPMAVVEREGEGAEGIGGGPFHRQISTMVQNPLL